jgi:E3 ubiquitin-protein ligase MARCH6
VHVAVDELLGFRGPAGSLARNALWLLAFTGAYLGTAWFVPVTLGRGARGRLAPLAAGRLPPVLRAAGELLHDDANTVHPADVGHALLGFLLAGAANVLARDLLRLLNRGSRDPDSPLSVLCRALAASAAVVKVAALLALKMVILPLLLGTMLDFATLPLFEATPADRAKVRPASEASEAESERQRRPGDRLQRAQKRASGSGSRKRPLSASAEKAP